MPTQALIIEDKPADAFIAQTYLLAAGFDRIEIAQSVLRGVEQARILLRPDLPPIPTVIIVDLLLPDRHWYGLEGRLAVSSLVSEMEAGRINLSHIVALTSYPTPEREQQALLAGCALFLVKPMTRALAENLRLLVDQVPVVPFAAADEIVQLTLRQDAAALLHLLSQLEKLSGTLEWTEKDTRALLTRPTTVIDVWEPWIRARGGIDRVQDRLRALPLPQELYELLNAVLYNGRNWQMTCEALHISRAEYYKRLSELVSVVRGYLNQWRV